MKSAEQQIREMLGRAGVENPETYSAGDLVELANLIAEIAKQRVMRKQLEDWNKELVEALEEAREYIVDTVGVAVNVIKEAKLDINFDGHTDYIKLLDALIAKHKGQS